MLHSLFNASAFTGETGYLRLVKRSEGSSPSLAWAAQLTYGYIILYALIRLSISQTEPYNSIFLCPTAYTQFSMRHQLRQVIPIVS